MILLTTEFNLRSVFMSSSPIPSKLRVSLDSWAVIVALVAVLLIRVGLLKIVPW
jgi:hypothetical protein